MFTRLSCISVYGIEVKKVDVEVNISEKGFPGFTIVGIPQKQAEESKERIKTAIVNSDIEFPTAKITVNLSPADLPKDSAVFDLPIGIGILASLKEIPQVSESCLFYGELSLDGKLQNSKGVFPLALYSKDNGINEIYVPTVNANEAAIIASIKTFPVESLSALIKHLKGSKKIEALSAISFENYPSSPPEFDFNEIQGQEQIKRAVEIACAGGHNILLSGPPGAGKTMIAKAIPGILPDLSLEESIELTRIYSVTGNIPAGGSLVRTRPFRSPHHTISTVALVGGGSNPHPGEVSLGHRGVLFIDETPEMSRSCIEALRQPLEDGYVSISRVNGSFRFPAKFMLVAAANPCPCGYLGNQKRQCICSRNQILNYNKKLSGPILDRIDMHVQLEAVETSKLSIKSSKSGESSLKIKERVNKARLVQLERYREEPGIFTNSELKNKQIKKFIKMDNQAEILLSQAINNLQLSARTFFRLIKISQTIADLEGCQIVLKHHVAEAIQYRLRDGI